MVRRFGEYQIDGPVERHLGCAVEDLDREHFEELSLVTVEPLDIATLEADDGDLAEVIGRKSEMLDRVGGLTIEDDLAVSTLDVVQDGEGLFLSRPTSP